MNDKNFANAIANLCYCKFKTIPKKGKPQEKKEWTLLSGIVARINIKNRTKLEVVALSTGTKCLGKTSLSNEGVVVNDSHAEVLTRRAFIRFILHEMTMVINGGQSEILELDKVTGVFDVRPGVDFHFFSSHTPCGDASIFPKDIVEICNKRSLDENEDELSRKKFKPMTVEVDVSLTDVSNVKVTTTNELTETSTTTDIFRTGAKCVSRGMQDPKRPGQEYHVTSALRTKPGRGDPTLSMSCSDKMAMWNICGIQGALLSHLVHKPIYLSSIVIGKCPFDKFAMQRAINLRTADVDYLPETYCHVRPQILQSELPFELSRDVLFPRNKKVVPCPAALIWCNIPNENADVCVNGRRQGVTKKNFNKPSSWVSVCRRNILQEYITVLHLMKKHYKLPEILK